MKDLIIQILAMASEQERNESKRRHIYKTQKTFSLLLSC